MGRPKAALSSPFNPIIISLSFRTGYYPGPFLFPESEPFERRHKAVPHGLFQNVCATRSLLEDAEKN